MADDVWAAPRLGGARPPWNLVGSLSHRVALVGPMGAQLGQLSDCQLADDSRGSTADACAVCHKQAARGQLTLAGSAAPGGPKTKRSGLRA